jgi:2-dehydro-3-deoxyphosphooctonate aldolase (KDO 8-P synthase)
MPFLLLALDTLLTDLRRLSYPRRMFHPSSFTIGDVTVGGSQLFLIAGPCVIESETHARTMADGIQRIASDLKMPYIFKASYDKANRTSIHSFRGPGLVEGTRILRAIGESHGLPVLTDVHAPDQCAQVSDALGTADVMLQIPAFLCRQTDLLIAAAETGRASSSLRGTCATRWRKFAIRAAASREFR